jgi:hypothetical protein
MSLRLKNIVHYDSLALFLSCDGVLTPVFAIGENAVTLASLRIPAGDGLAGWAV